MSTTKKVSYVTKPKTSSKSVNVVSKSKSKKKKRTSYAPSKSFRLAYNKMQRSKEQRFAFSDLDMATDTLAHSVALQNCTAITQGTQSNMRLQNSAYVSYIKWTGTIQSNEFNKAKFLRLIVFGERNAAHLNTTTFSDLFLDSSFADTAPNMLQRTVRIPVNKEQYRVYFNRVIKVPIEAEGNYYWKHDIKIGRKVWWPQADSGSSVPTNGYLYAIMLLCEGDNQQNTVTSVVSSQLRVFFKDS